VVDLSSQPVDEAVVMEPRPAVPRPRRLLRSAIIGTGFVGPFHVDAVRRGGYAEVVALAGSDPARTAARARDLAVPLATTDVARLLADPGIDVVHICTPNRTHVELASAALEAGKHVVVEKPVALNASDAAALAALARRLDRHATVAFTYRGYPMVRRARRLVQAGELGDLRLVHGEYIQDWLSEATDYNWRIEPEIGGASRAVADIGSHWFDTAEFIAGRRIESVLADVATFVPRRRRPSGGGQAFVRADAHGEEVEIRSEDAATILVRFEGGARGACVVSQVSPGRKNGFELELAGSHATLDWAQEDPEHLWLRSRDESRLLTRGPADGPEPETRGVPSLPAGHPEGWAEALRDLLRPFYAAIVAEDRPVDPDLADVPYPRIEDGARAVAFVEATLASARDGRWTPISAARSLGSSGPGSKRKSSAGRSHDLGRRPRE
jgi:predicted dehydrogenase